MQLHNSDTGIPGLCPGVFLQKIVYIQHAGSGSTPKRESAMKQALIPDRSHRTLSPVSIVSLTQKALKDRNISCLLKMFSYAGTAGGPPCQIYLNTV